jgi:hypothetical protein
VPEVNTTPNNRVQATAGVSAVLNNHGGGAPAAPDAARYTASEQW